MRKNALDIIAVIFAIAITVAFIPVDNVIKLDGVISEGEWKNAHEYALAGEGKLMMYREGPVLFIAMLANKNSWAHVYLSHGDTVRVLHASAALGEAVYIKKNNLYQPRQDFHWEMREQTYNKEMMDKQELYFKKHGWVANNNNTGNGKTFEFMIDLRTGGSLSFACLVLDDPAQPHHYPPTLTDHTILPHLMQGFAADSLKFNPGSWEQLR